MPPFLTDRSIVPGPCGRTLLLTARDDPTGQAPCFGQLGTVAYDRFREARKANRPPEECAGHFSSAQKYFVQALETFPTNAAGDLAATHNQLGILDAYVGQLDSALRNFRESIRYREAMRDRFAA